MKPDETEYDRRFHKAMRSLADMTAALNRAYEAGYFNSEEIRSAFGLTENGYGRGGRQARAALVEKCCRFLGRRVKISIYALKEPFVCTEDGGPL